MGKIYEEQENGSLKPIEGVVSVQVMRLVEAIRYIENSNVTPDGKMAAFAKISNIDV